MATTITTQDPEFDEVLRELALNRQAVVKRRELSEASFREWLFQEVQEIGHRLGFTIQGLAEFMKDMSYGWKKGIAQGREDARNKSIRAREGQA